jgi:hypothetical protein
MSTEKTQESAPSASRCYPVLGNVNGLMIVKLPNGQNAAIDVSLFIDACQSIWDEWGDSINATDRSASGYEAFQKVRKALKELG